MNLFEDKKENSSKENDLYSFPPFDSFHGESQSKTPPLVLELIQLPLLSESFEQMPVGARGWYASAILSAMVMMSYYGSSNQGLGDSASKMTKGTDFLREDLGRACSSMLRSKANDGYKSNVFLELGSGTIGLGGMTLAWIAAQHEHNAVKSKDAATRRNKVVMTDYDHDCLEQLERNAVGVRKAFREYFSAIGSNDTDIVDNDIIPDIGVEKLDWTEYDQDQSPLLPDGANIDDENSISFVCGAALVYMEDTAACVDQVAKILKRHPKAVVWVVQWPRDGWFSIFQQELQSSKFRSDDLNIQVQKFGPTSSPDMFSEEILLLAQKLMPGNTHQEVEMNIKDLRAIRITNTVS